MISDKQPIKVEISYKTVIFTVVFLILLWLVVQIREIIILVFISIILLSGLLRPVEYLQSKRLPRALAVIIVYIGIIAFIAFTIGTIVPPLVSQTSEFGNKLPQVLISLNDYLLKNKIPVENLSDVMARQVQSIVGNLLTISTTIFSSIFLIITVLVLTFYLLLEWKSFLKLIASPFSGRQEKRVIRIVSEVEHGLGGWLRAQLTLSLTIGILTYIGLRIIGIPFALPLALIAGILEIIPIVGPIVSAIPAILVGLTFNPVIALTVAALFFVIQQIENHFVVPFIMSKVVGLQPPVVIIALLVGAKLAGIGGAFLAVPIIVVVKILFIEFFREDQNLKDELKESY